MATSYFDQLSQNPNKFMNMEPVFAFNGITTRLYSELARENIQMMTELMQCGVEQMQGLSHARGFEEVMNVQSKTMAKATPQIIEHAQHMLDAMMTSATEYSKLFEKNVGKVCQVQTKAMQEVKDKVEKR